MRGCYQIMALGCTSSFLTTMRWWILTIGSTFPSSSSSSSFVASAFAIHHDFSGRQTRMITPKHSDQRSYSTLLPRLGLAQNNNNGQGNLESSQLAQLASMTVLSIDSGDLKVIQQYADTGYITDATTNPLFVSQAGLSGDPVYASMVDQAVQYAIQETAATGDEAETVSLAIDRLAVLLGKAIADIVPGYVSTEVDPRLSFDTEASISRALRIIAMYKDLGVPKERILIKLAATWEGIRAAEVLERDHGIQCNLTLIFSVVQAIACAQYGAHLISPFPGRILDWFKVTLQRASVTDPELDEGVIACKEMYAYFKTHGHDTICMPASWRPSRGSGYELDEIRALAGTDRMTIPPPLLEKLAASHETLERKLSSDNVQPVPLVANGKMDEKEFRYRLTMDGCGNDKLAEGIRSFVELTEKLDAAIREKVRAAALSSA